MDAAPVRLPTPVAVERIVSPGLRWLYALVAVDLAGAGAGAGQALYTAYDLGHYADAVSCLQSSGIGAGDLTRLTGDGLAARIAGFDACTGAYNRGQGLAMLAGAVVLPLLAGLLMLLGAAAAARRTRAGRRTRVDGPAVRAVVARFGHWCDAMGLVGRDRPELVLARAGRGALRAYTTALPRRRPRVVVPVGYAYAPVEELDLILLHELAHVRMRDVTWAAATWWTGWLSVPVLLAAFGPLVLRPSLWGPRVVAAVGLAALLSLVTLLLRAAVLRRRECLADRYAVVRGGCLGALRTATAYGHGRARLFAGPLRGGDRGAPVGAAGAGRVRLFARSPRGGDRGAPVGAAGAGRARPFAGPPRGGGRHAVVRGGRLGALAAAAGRARGLARPFAGHLRGADRVAAATAGETGWEGGAVVAAAAGLWWMFGLQTVQVALMDLLGFGGVDGRLVPSIALTVASLGWAATLVPLWSRAAASRPAGAESAPAESRVRARVAGMAGQRALGSRWSQAAGDHRAPAASRVWARVAGTAGQRAPGSQAAGTERAPAASQVSARVAGPAEQRAPRSAWAQAAGGTAGLVAGFYLQPPGTLVPVGATLAGGHMLAAVPWTAAALAGASLLAALLAKGGQGLRGTRARVALVGAVVGAAAALYTATDTVWTLLRAHWLYGSVAVDRHLFLGFGGYWWAGWTPALLIAACVVIAVAARVPLRRDLPLVATAAAGAGAVAVAATQVRLAHADAEGPILHLLADRWWMCALAGWAVTLVALLRHRFLPAAVVAGAVAAVLAGLLQYGRDVVTGPTGHGLNNLVGFVRMPVWLLCATVLFTLPLVAALPGGRRSRWGPVLAVVAALAVAGGYLAPISGREGDRAAFLAALRGRPVPGAALPERPLTPGEAADRLGRVRAGLPHGWAAVPNADGGPDTGVEPEACDRRWAEDRAAEQGRGAVADETTTAEYPDAALRLTVNLRSYPGEAGARAGIDEALEDARVCPVWTVDFAPADDHRMRAEVSGADRSDGYRIRVTLTYRYHGEPMCIAWVQAGVAAGPNLAAVTLGYPLPRRSAVTEAQWRDAEAIAVGVLHATAG